MTPVDRPSCDVHTHVGLDTGFHLRGWWPYALTTQQLLADMDRNGIKRAVCFPFTLPSAFDVIRFADSGEVNLLPDRFPFDRENQLLLLEVARVDVRKQLLPFAMFDPAREQERQAEAIESRIGEIHGLKVQSTVIQSPIRALLKEGRCLMELAGKYDLPVLIHTSIAPTDLWAQTSDCLEVAAAYPRVRFNLAHSLRFHQPSLIAATKLANVWVDCSAHLIHCALACRDSPAVAVKSERVDADYATPWKVLETIHQMLPGKYLWGSDAPFMSWVDDQISHRFSYDFEVAALYALPADLRRSMSQIAPGMWLGETG